MNPTDWQARRGLLRPTTTDTVPHQDGAGIIDAVGPGADTFAVGDRVWTDLAAFGRPHGGTAQELTNLPATRVHPLPDDVSYDVGATLGVAAVTAHRALTVTEGTPEHIRPGSLELATVLVAGGAGAVGHAAIQLARWAGATVIATVSTAAKAELALAAGAHHAVDYRAEDAALDTAVLAQGGTLVAYANEPGERLSLDLLALMNLNARVQFVRLFAIPAPALARAVEDVTAAAAAHALEVGPAAGLPLHRFPLESTIEAHEAAEAGVVGKVVVDVAAL